MGKANLPYFGRAVGKANLGRNLSGQGKFALFRLCRNLSGQGKFALVWVGRAGTLVVGGAGTLVGKANLPYFGRGKAGTLVGKAGTLVGKAGTLVGKANLPYFGWVGTLVGKANLPCFGSARPEP